jgi:hypothetical protein
VQRFGVPPVGQIKTLIEQAKKPAKREVKYPREPIPFGAMRLE